jgi:hypothetical protein
MLNGRWHKVGYIVYTDSNGNVTARCHGTRSWRSATSRPPFPSSGQRSPCRWASATPADSCSGHSTSCGRLPDAHARRRQPYDQDEALAMELEFDWDLHPCFPRAGKVSKALPHVENEGVPSCPHGLMHRDRHDDFPTATWRKKNGIPRGERAREDDARIRWNCPVHAHGCANVTTRPRNNARLYTFYPRAGDSPLATKRTALRIRRGSVESTFSTLKGRGVGGKGHQRLKLIGDSPADWIISLAALHLTAAASHTRPARTPTRTRPRSTSATAPSRRPRSRSRTPRSTRSAASPPPIRCRAGSRRARCAAPPRTTRTPGVRPRRIHARPSRFLRRPSVFVPGCRPAFPDRCAPLPGKSTPRSARIPDGPATRKPHIHGAFRRRDLLHQIPDRPVLAAA